MDNRRNNILIPQCGKQIRRRSLFDSLPVALPFLAADDRPQLRYINRYVKGDLCSACVEDKDLWHTLGIELMGEDAIPRLNVIKIDEQSTPGRCWAMFNAWSQRNPDASWQKLIEALRNVRLGDIADKLEKALENYSLQEGLRSLR